MSIRTLIVDDESLARDRVKRFLKPEADVEIVGECTNGRDAVAAITETKPDLVFLDIQMPEKDGFEVVRSLKADTMPTIIFVTAYDQYALQAFEVHALDYLLKPFNQERIRKAVERAREHIGRRRVGSLDERLVSLLADLKTERKFLERLVVKTVGRVYFLKVDEIDWIEAAGNYVKLHVGRDGHMLRETMSGIEGKLDPERFVRIHRSTLVNVDRIKELHPLFSGDYSVMLHDGTELALSRNYRERFLEMFEGSQ